MTDGSTFVGRTTEMARLRSLVDQARSGNGQVCFITGEAGSGKTTLTMEFARQAQISDTELVVAIGQCDSQTGAGSAYLPFREILDMLTGEADSKAVGDAVSGENASRLRSLVHTSGEALIELAPDLIGLFVPWAGLAMQLGTFAAQKGGLTDRVQELMQRRKAAASTSAENLDQGQIFEQYVRLLRALASDRTLVVVIDDLQWSDSSSLELLFRLGRRLEDSRILVIGTYRPEEVALGRSGERHPLDKVVSEFKRYFGDIRIDLDRAKSEDGPRFIGELIDVEPNALGSSFREALLRHTGGNALFAVELLRSMQERDDLVRDSSGQWVESPALDWTALPARIEGVIEERVHRLQRELRETLTIASVEGPGFTAEVIARVRNLEARQLVRSLSGVLEKQHRLIVSQGVQHIGSSRLSRYRFLHDLFHQYLYAGLDESERMYIHEDVARVLEELYGERADEICVQLARHYEAAGIMDKARLYLSAAGQQAADQHAHQEAVTYLSRALELTPQDACQERYKLLLTREQVHRVRGDRNSQIDDLRTLDHLAHHLAEDEKKAEIALRRALCAETGSDFTEAIGASQEAIALGETSGNVQAQARGYLQWGRALWRQGHYAESVGQLRHALKMSEEAGLETLVADCLSNLGIVYWYRGDHTIGRDYLERALPARQGLDDRLGEAHILNNLAGVSYECGDHQSAVDYQEQALQLYRQSGYRRGQGLALSNLSVFVLEQGKYEQAKGFLDQSLLIYREIEDLEGETAALINLGIISDNLGRYKEARALLDGSLAISRETGDLKGELEALIYASLVGHHLGENDMARQLAGQALAIAKESADRRSESHSLLHLAHSLTAAGSWSAAIEAYADSAEIRREAGEHHRSMEALAGLARVRTLEGDFESALSIVEDILAFLQADTLEGTDEPIRIFITCFEVLRKHADPRAGQVLEEARKLLRHRADLIHDPETRRGYLESIRSHRDLRHALADW